MNIYRDGQYMDFDGTEETFYMTSLPGKGWIIQDPPPPPAPTNEEVIADLTRALEAHYDATAQTRRYDIRLTCALRAGYAGPFQAEGTAFAIWMDTCNAYGYQVMADCLAGLRAIPTAAQLIAELPVISW